MINLTGLSQGYFPDRLSRKDSIVKIEQNQITGSLTEDPLSSVSIHFDDIEKIELESVDGGKTVLAVVGGILLLPILLLGLLFGVAESVESNSQ